jgi:hypothetical protein
MSPVFYHDDVNRLMNQDVLNRIHQIVFYLLVDFDLEFEHFPIEVQLNNDSHELLLELMAFLNVHLIRIKILIDKRQQQGHLRTHVVIVG